MEREGGTDEGKKQGTVTYTSVAVSFMFVFSFRILSILLGILLVVFQLCSISGPDCHKLYKM